MTTLLALAALIFTGPQTVTIPHNGTGGISCRAYAIGEDVALPPGYVHRVSIPCHPSYTLPGTPASIMLCDADTGMPLGSRVGAFDGAAVTVDFNGVEAPPRAMLIVSGDVTWRVAAPSPKLTDPDWYIVAPTLAAWPCGPLGLGLDVEVRP
jgi:hypothetical protein